MSKRKKEQLTGDGTSNNTTSSLIEQINTLTLDGNATTPKRKKS